MKAKIHDVSDTNIINEAEAQRTHFSFQTCSPTTIPPLEAFQGPDGQIYNSQEFVELRWWVDFNNRKSYSDVFYICRISIPTYQVLVGEKAMSALRSQIGGPERSSMHTFALRSQDQGTFTIPFLILLPFPQSRPYFKDKI